MMRPNLHLITERRQRRGGSRDATPARRSSGPTHGRRSEPTPRSPVATPADGQAPCADHDEAARRVREAGGPVDQGLYSCSCGLVFEAPVSTSVVCPHCGDSQAW